MASNVPATADFIEIKPLNAAAIAKLESYGIDPSGNDAYVGGGLNIVLVLSGAALGVMLLCGLASAIPLNDSANLPSTTSTRTASATPVRRASHRPQW